MFFALIWEGWINLTELIPSEIIPLIWFSGISITVYFFFRKFSSLIVEKIKQSATAKKRSESGANTGEQVDNLIDNVTNPQLLRGIEKQIAEQKAAGVSDEQMKGLYRNRDLARLAVDNKQIIDFTKPILKRVIKSAQGWC